MTQRARFGDVFLPGAVGGLLAGAVVGLWFLAVDLIAGQPFTTPGLLGQVLMQFPEFALTFRLIASYTILHFGVFVLLGIGAAWFVKAMSLTPGLLLGLVFGGVVLDFAYYGALLITGANVMDVLPWYQVVPANALAGMVLMAYLHRAFHSPQPLGWGVLRNKPLTVQGITAGLMGAAVVAIWFLALDLIGGRPLHTPAALASALFLGAQGDSDIRIGFGLLVGYSIVHVAVFVAAGLLLVAAAEYVQRAPSRVLVVALTLIVLEAAVISALLLGAEWVLGSVGLWAITAANVLAVAVMGWYVWRAHEGLGARLREAKVDV